MEDLRLFEGSIKSVSASYRQQNSFKLVVYWRLNQDSNQLTIIIFVRAQTGAKGRELFYAHIVLGYTN